MPCTCVNTYFFSRYVLFYAFLFLFYYSRNKFTFLFFYFVSFIFCLLVACGCYGTHIYMCALLDDQGEETLCPIFLYFLIKNFSLKFIFLTFIFCVIALDKVPTGNRTVTLENWFSLIGWSICYVIISKLLNTMPKLLA